MMTAFWHLTWKVSRQSGVLAGADRASVACEGLLAYMAGSHVREPGFTEVMMAWAMGISALFAVGSAGMAFAAEREEGTIDFLRSIPVTARQVLASKLAVSIAATLAFYSITYCITLYFTHGEVPPTRDMRDGWRCGSWRDSKRSHGERCFRC